MYTARVCADRGAEMALWQQTLSKLETFQTQLLGGSGGGTWLHSIQLCQ